jgi:hypothetical protein
MHTTDELRPSAGRRQPRPCRLRPPTHPLTSTNQTTQPTTQPTDRPTNLRQPCVKVALDSTYVFLDIDHPNTYLYTKQ